MNRRAFLGLAGSAGAVGAAGCSAPGNAQALTDPTVQADSDRRKHLTFTADGEEVATVGVDGAIDDGVIELPFQIWHREGTTVESISLQVWTPPREATAQVALVSPVSGDSSPPPAVTLSVPDRGQGQLIEISDLDDLADETISTLELLVRPGEGWTGTVSVDATVELGSSGVFESDYSLDGRLELSFAEGRNR